MAKEAKPDFIDNRDGNTLAKALANALGVTATGGDGHSTAPPDEVCIASAYFSPTGFARIADHLEPVPTVRLLLGADLTAGTLGEKRHLGEDEEKFARRQLRTGLNRMDDALCRDRDRLPFTRPSGAALRKLITALHAGNMEVRRYESSFLHAKAYIFTPSDTPSGDATGRPEGIIVGSSNLTGAGLTGNLELNLGRYDRPIIKKARQWFDDLWEEAKPYDLAKVFEEVFQPCEPWDVFIRVLWQLYGDEVEADTKNDGNLPLTSFQKHGVARALRLIRNTGGAIVADEVGLGKTFIAGEVLDIYRNQRQRALLICPAALRDSTWKKFINRFQVYVECLSFEELANDVQLRDARRPNADQVKLQRPLDEYQLVIVDEAHNYRNPDAPTRSAALRTLLFGRRRDVLLLTATPVNNSLWDLYHLMRFFVRQDAQFAGRGILSIRERFDRAMREDPSSLSPDVLYPIIDATTVKRTRQFVKKHYKDDNIEGPEGKPVPIVFPKPKAISVRYNLDDLLPGFFDRLESALEPDGDDAIRFARYMPDEYLRKGGGGDHADSSDGATEIQEESARTRAMVGLLRSGILKRFESSAFAFRQTVGKMASEHDTFLDALEAGHVVNTKFMKELSADDEAVFEELLAGTEHRTDSKLYDVPRLRAVVQRDRDLLRELAEEAERITPDRDPKLRMLVEELVAIAEQAKEEATDSIDEAQKRKVLVFSFFEDTVEWIHEFLKKELKMRPELTGYSGRMEAVSGSDEVGEVSRQRAVHGFAPISMEAPVGQGDDLYDLLVSTDVLAEGVNLQQCRHIINFDMPWNPMRLVQRHGRIDRIGSPHRQVFMRTIFPVDRLDDMLNLERRILDKLAMAAASVGVEAPIEGAAHSSLVFTETREEIEKLLKDDATLFERGGTAGAAQTGEEYRQSLRKALDDDRERIANMPWKVGSGMMKGRRRGVFFCAVVGERTYLRFVPADEAWGVEIAGSAVDVRSDGDLRSERDLMDPGAKEAIIREVGTCLRLIECEPDTPIWCPEDLQDRVYDFWEVAQEDILADWMRETDPKNLQPRIRPLNHRVAEFIRGHPPIDMSDELMTRALDILESPWPRREEVMLRGWYESDRHKGAALSKSLIEEIHNTGLEPVVPPPLLPGISKDDIDLLCWMGIERSDDGAASEK